MQDAMHEESLQNIYEFRIQNEEGKKSDAEAKIMLLEKYEAEMLDKLKNTYEQQKHAFSILEQTVNEPTSVKFINKKPLYPGCRSSSKQNF